VKQISWLLSDIRVYHVADDDDDNGDDDDDDE